MKSIRLILVSLLFTLPAIAAESTPAQTTPVPKVDYKDAFLSFALDKAKTYSGALENAVAKAVDTAVVETPILVKEYISWKLWKSGISAIFSLAIVLASIFYGVPKFYRMAKDSGNYMSGQEVGGVFGTVGSVGLAIGFSIAFCINALTFVQILVAPRVYLIEQVMAMAGKR